MRLLNWRALSSLFLFSFIGLFSLGAGATTYTLPAAVGSGLFSSCSLSGTTINCSSAISLGTGDVLTSATSSYTLNVAGNFVSGTTNTIGTVTYAVNVVSTSNITLSASSTMYGNATAAAGTVTLGNNAVLTGNLLASSSSLGTGASYTGILCTGTCNSSTSISLVNSVPKFNSASATSIQSTAFPANPVVGNVIVVVAWSFNSSSAPTLSASDNFGNTYTSIAQKNVTSGANYQNTAILIAPIKTTGASFKVTVSAPVGSTQIEAVALQYAGIGAIDQVNATTTAVHPVTISTTAATTSINELVIAANSVATPATSFTSITSAAGYSLLANQINNSGFTAGEADSKTTTTLGVQTDSWTYASSAGTWATAQAIATFFPGTPIKAPTVTTNAASSITSNSATLNSTVLANNASTAVTFDYGTVSGTYTNTNLVATGSPVTTSGNPTYAVTGLACSTTYYFRAKGTNTATTTLGSELSFTTLSCAGDFDAYETSFTAPTAAASKIYTHVASSAGLCVNGGSCSLKIGSFNLGTRVLNTAFTGPVKIEIVDGSSGTCATYASISTWQASQVLSTTGETTLALPAIASAYPNARVRVSYPATGAATNQSCSSDNFSIRPASFSVLFQDADASTAGTIRTLSTVTATGVPIHRAGSPLTVTVKALTLEGNLIASYVGTPSLALSACAGTACPSSLGALANAAGAFSAGIYTSNLATYSDVGAFTATYTDASFASVDSTDGTASSITNIAGSATVGRFVPHHFDVSLTQGCTTGTTPFTYNAQPFAMSVTARNASGATTTNYSSATGLAQAVTLAAQGAFAGALSLTSLPSTAFNVGADTLLSTAGQSYTYTSKLTGPSTLSIRATDPDAVTSNPASGGTEAGLLIRSGRLKAFSTSGGDLSSMLVPLALQYYDGSTWVANGDDACTTLAVANLSLTSPTNASATYTPSAPVLTAGSGYVSIAPSASSGRAAGTVNLAVDLGSSGVDQSCNPLHGGSPLSRPWLRSYFGSCSAAADRDPSAQLNFGSYTNESKRQVYIREVR